jgi:DHA2 family multidrug resistance protein-like MFS transporter
MVCFMAGAAIGPLVGGMLLNTFWWGSAFLVGVPAMALLLITGPRLLPESRDPSAGRLDLTSVALSLAAILPIIYGLKELAKDGWRPLSVAAVIAGVVVGVAFVRRQRRLADPLLDLSLFASRTFTTALGGMMFGTLLAGSIMLFITQYFQLVEGLSPLRAGLCMLPAVAGSTASSLASPHLARRARPAYVMAIGMVIAAVGLLVITQAGATTGLAAVVTGFALINFGCGPMVVLTIDLIIGSAPPAKAGSAAGMNETSGQFGFALGIAALGSLGTAVYRHQITHAVPAGTPPVAARAARDTLAAATTAARDLPERLGTALLNPAREAFTSGMHIAAGLCAVLLVVVALLTAVLLRHIPPSAPTAPTHPSAP